MKKLLSILCIAVIGLTASSCKKETIVAPNNNQTIIQSVNSSAWVSTDGGATYAVDLDVPEIDSYANDNYAILVYISFTNGVWEQVPEVYQGNAFSFTHNPGFVSLYAQRADGAQAATRPDNMQVKIVLVDSQP
ncbi:hypothetical protein FPZ43_04665 [Mucilaginibacter pallidiroseus]|uniref:Uncharacterized protein n=1 Tax=Mucilaginibacter pallidiroseus TaxID=2599295 RepID=A0A563UFS9_9SPHI|nr:hypothetical protein [Mucilaginibacter pallidiroseus]TWR30240.1 hypothetical protein FPZ43_04665 [Mucilaginibacter pallidiroseus]